ncbi:hypothetical protein AB2C39_32380, partial [Pseudomonas aeruginosa]
MAKPLSMVVLQWMNKKDHPGVGETPGWSRGESNSGNQEAPAADLGGGVARQQVGLFLEQPR